MQAQESHQNANTTSYFHILQSTSTKANKSLHYFIEVLPFSAWPAHLIFFYITLTSTNFLSKFPQLVIKKTYEKTVENTISLSSILEATQ